MKRGKRFFDMDVLTAARLRTIALYDAFDTVVVNFSGGKDSLVCLMLAKEAAEFRGRLPVDVIFRDEEIIPDEVIDFVNEYRQKDWVRMRWYTIPTHSSVYVLGTQKAYIQWDPAREWVRPKPPWGINLAPGDNRVFTQYNTDALISVGYPGRVCSVLGLRAGESLLRLSGALTRGSDTYLGGSYTGTRVAPGYPIYDWSQSDVFKYFYDHNIQWCPAYDTQLLVGDNFRISTPLHSEAAKRQFGKKLLRRKHPEFYERILKLFPEMTLEERYNQDVNVNLRSHAYAADGWPGVLRAIDENIAEPKLREVCMKRLRSWQSAYKKDPDSWPLYRLVELILCGKPDRGAMPLDRQTQAKLRAEREKADAS